MCLSNRSIFYNLRYFKRREKLSLQWLWGKTPADSLAPQNSLSSWQRRTCRLVFMVSCDPAPPPQCSWFSGRERKQVEGVREEGRGDGAGVYSRHSNWRRWTLTDGSGASGASGAGGEDLICQAEKRSTGILQAASTNYRPLDIDQCVVPCSQIAAACVSPRGAL